MKQERSNREKKLLNLSELIGESYARLQKEIIILDKLLWLLIYNAGENYSEDFCEKFEKQENKIFKK